MEVEVQNKQHVGAFGKQAGHGVPFKLYYGRMIKKLNVALKDDFSVKTVPKAQIKQVS